MYDTSFLLRHRDQIAPMIYRMILRSFFMRRIGVALSGDVLAQCLCVGHLVSRSGGILRTGTLK